MLVWAGFALASPSAGRAALVWAETRQVVKLDAAAAEAAAVFTFTNTGRSAVTIREVQTSCGCTAAVMDKKRYAAGEAGTLVMRLKNAGDRRMLEESATIVTDEPDGQPWLLTLRVDVEGELRGFQRIEVTPKRVEWNRGENAEPKVVALRIRPNDALRPVAVKAEGDGFTVELRPRVATPVRRGQARNAEGEAGDETWFEVVVTPRGTARVRSARVTITTNSVELQPEWSNAPALTFEFTAAVR